MSKGKKDNTHDAQIAENSFLKSVGPEMSKYKLVLPVVAYKGY